MEERYLEIRFCIFIDKLFKTFNYSVDVLSIIEAYSMLADVSISFMKQLSRQVHSDSGIIKTYKEEMVYIARELGISFRKLEKDTGISSSTQYRIAKRLEANPNMYKGITKHLSEIDYMDLKKFMIVVDKMKEVHK